MIVNMTVQLDKDVLNLVVMRAMGAAGMSFQQRMLWGSEISNSILKQAAEESEIFQNLYHVKLQSIDFEADV